MNKLEKAVKALKQCMMADGCRECPYYEALDYNCTYKRDKETLELIETMTQAWDAMRKTVSHRREQAVMGGKKKRTNELMELENLMFFLDDAWLEHIPRIPAKKG